MKKRKEPWVVFLHVVHTFSLSWIAPSSHLAVTAFPVATAPSGQTRNQFMEGASLSVTGGSLHSLALNVMNRALQPTHPKHYHTAN